MEEIYKTPESNLVEGFSPALNNTKLYKISGIGIAAFFGSVLAAGYLLSENLKRLGRLEEAKKCFIYSVLGQLGILLLGWLVPDEVPNTAFTIPIIFLMVHISKQRLETDLIQHEKDGGVFYSNWRAFGLSLLIVFLMLALILALILPFSDI